MTFLQTLLLPEYTISITSTSVLESAEFIASKSTNVTIPPDGVQRAATEV